MKRTIQLFLSSPYTKLIIVMIPVIAAFIGIYSFLSTDKKISYKTYKVNIITYQEKNKIKVYKKNVRNIYAQRVIFENTGNKTVEQLKLDISFIDINNSIPSEKQIYMQEIPEKNSSKYIVEKFDDKCFVISFFNINPAERYELLFTSQTNFNISSYFDAKNTKIKESHFLDLSDEIIYSCIFFFIFMLFIIFYLHTNNKKIDKETKFFVKNINEIFEKKQEELDFYRKELDKYKSREYDNLYS